MADIGGAVSVGGSLLSGFMGSKSAESAADQQAAMAQAAIDEQKRQFNVSRKDLAPWRRTGGQAMDELGYLLGLGGSSATRSAQSAVDAAQRRYDNLVSQRGGGGGAGGGGGGGGGFWAIPTGGNMGGRGSEGDGGSYRVVSRGDAQHIPGARRLSGGGAGAGASAADIAAARRELNAARKALTDAEATPFDMGGRYGSLMQDFGHEDFYADPGYQFRLSEGSKGVYRPGSALGNYLSGAQAKALTRYNQGFASNEYSNAYNRDAANKARKFGFLSGAAGMGQSSAHQVANLGAQSASNIGNLQTQIGNVRAAGTVGASNAWQGALGDIGNYYQTKDLLSRFSPSRSSSRSSYRPTDNLTGGLEY